MKKTISILLILVMFLSLTACSNQQKPETTVSEFIEAAKMFNFEKMASIINPSSSPSKEKISELEKGSEENSYEKYFMDYLKSNAKKITYEIKDSTIDGDNATVTVDFKYVDGGPLLKSTIGDVFSQVISMAFAGVEMNDEEMSQLLVSSMEKQKENISETFTERTVNLKCIKIENKWYLDDISDDFLDVIISNFGTVAEELDESFNDSSNGFVEDNLTVLGQAEEENMIIIEKNIGDEVVFATLNLKVNSVEEKQSINSSYSSAEAKEGAKFVVIDLELTNTTTKGFTFPTNMLLIDDKGREFDSYSDSIGNIDNYIDYRDLAPSIKETGYLVYEVPTDALNYSIYAGKAGTDELYEITLK